MVVDTPAGEVVYGANFILVEKLSQVSVGDKIRVEYLGKRKSAAGREYGTFSVQIDSAPTSAGAAGGPASQAATAAPAKFDQSEFDRLKGLIAKDKSEGIAFALGAAAMATGDPVQSLREAMDQIGVVQF